MTANYVAVIRSCVAWKSAQYCRTWNNFPTDCVTTSLLVLDEEEDGDEDDEDNHEDDEDDKDDHEDDEDEEL